MPPHGSKKLKKRSRRPKQQNEKGKKYPKASVEEDLEENPFDQDSRQQLQRRSAHDRKNMRRALINLLEKTAAALTALGGREEVKNLFQAKGVEEEEEEELIQSHCNTIFTLLPRSKPMSKSSSGGLPSTLDLYDQPFVYRASSSLLYVLRPMDVFKGNVSYTRRKVLGFVQEKGANFPLMFSLPGWTKCADDHPRLLDSEFWTAEVMRWGGFHNHQFKKFVFDQHHGKEPGHTYASHTEPRLMLWYACNVYGALTGVAESIRTQIGSLWRLKDMRQDIEAEIFLTEAPCKPCLLFQELVEKYTGIKFTITVCPNLGRLKATKNKQNFKDYPLYASDSEEAEESQPDVDEDDEEERLQIMEETSSRLEVVIRGKPAPASRSSSSSQKKSKPSFAEYATSMMMTSNQKQQTIVRSKPKKLRRYSYYDSADEADYSPPTRQKSKSQTTHTSTPARNATAIGILTPPGSKHFGVDALEHAQRINDQKRKRHHERDDSPIRARKAHHIRF